MSIFRISVVATVAVGLIAGCGSGPALAGAAGLPPNPPRPETCAPPTSTDPTTAEGWLHRIATAPATVGFVVDDGRGRVISHEATTPMPLASAVKVVHLAAYGAAVAQGRVSPDEPVAVDDWERRYLPGGDGGAHTAALQRLGAASGGTVTVDQLVSAMIQESDNAAADWLRARLGDDALRAAAASGGWTDVDLPSLVGSSVRSEFAERVPADADRAQLAAVDDELGRQYADDPAFREEVFARFTAAAQDLPAYLARQEAWTATTAAGSAEQLLGMYRAIATGAVPGADVAQRHLAWQGVAANGNTLGFKGGSYVDVLTFGSFLRRTDGTIGYAVVLGRDLPTSPTTAEQAPGQQELALGALSSDGAVAHRLLCVA